MLYAEGLPSLHQCGAERLMVDPIRHGVTSIKVSRGICRRFPPPSIFSGFSALVRRAEIHQSTQHATRGVSR